MQILVIKFEKSKFLRFDQKPWNIPHSVLRSQNVCNLMEREKGSVVGSPVVPHARDFGEPVVPRYFIKCQKELDIS